MFPDFNNSMEGLAWRKKIKSQPLNGKGEKRHLRTPNQTHVSCTKPPDYRCKCTEKANYYFM